MRLSLLPFLIFTCVTMHVFPVIRRHDLSDEDYLSFGKEALFTPVGRIISSCGLGTGTLITNRLVVTAGHCIPSREKCSFLLEVPEMGQVLAVRGVALHKKGFSPETNPSDSADIALIYLDTPIDEVMPMKLSFAEDLEGRLFVSAGYGKHGTGNREEGGLDQKKRGYSNLISTIKENSYYLSIFYNPDMEAKWCTPLEGGGAPGDSGSPVLIRQDGEWVFVGIMTFSRGDGAYGTINGILSFNDYRDWLEEYLSL